MGEQIPYGIAESLLTKLGSAVFHEIRLMYGVGSELRKFEGTLSTVRAVLVDAEEKQETSHAVAVWVRRHNDAVYDADDLFDDFAAEELRRKTDSLGRFGGQVSDFFSSSNQLAFRFNMGHRIKAIRESLDDLASDISKFNFIPRVVISGNRGRETCSVVEKSHEIVGRDEDKMQIIELLMQSSSSHEENLSMVGIVGIGGLGKTTLAQLAYNDQGVAAYFDLKMWVCVSDDFDVKILVRNVIKSATNRDVENLELDQLQQLLRQNLDGKRYLLVLDDVWNEDRKKWGQFITLLPVGVNGSKVLVTTRSTRVASVMGIDSPYIVEGLKDDVSWELFESLAFRKGEEQKYPNLVAIGKEIVKMCKGVPLVIKTIGRILHFKTQESQWLDIKNNRSLMLLGDENDVLSVLRLSYDNLPIHLKQCFAYCALFPKDYIIDRRDLAQLWIAQGYIQPSHENECLEDVGNEYFEDLLTRSLFQEIEEHKTDRVVYYRMHDLIHDLAQSIVKSHVIISMDNVRSIPKRVHHVSLFRETHEMPKDLMDNPIRTIFKEYLSDDHCTTNKFISRLKCLRVLKMTFGQHKHPLHEMNRSLRLQHKLPTSLGKLSHLRYLEILRGSFKNLPSSITRLKNLQTLKLLGCLCLNELPRDMKILINLRHLEINGCDKLTYMPRGLGELRKLQTLSLFLVGNESDSGEWWHKRKRMGRLNELRFLNNLRGLLVIEGLSNARGCEAKEAMLVGKQYLERLTLSYRNRRGSAGATQGSEEAVLVSVMESLQPHPNLKRQYLRNITVELCLHLMCVSSSLKSLEISNIKDLIYLPEGLQHLSTLHTLKIQSCNDLATLPDWIGLLTSLTRLTIYGCPKLTSFPEEMQSLRNLRQLQIYSGPYLSKRCKKETGEDWPKISHIPNIIIHGEVDM